MSGWWPLCSAMLATILTDDNLFPLLLFRLFDGLQLFEIERLVDADLFDELGDVADKHHCTFVLVEGFGDHGQVAEIDVVRWLVQDE